MNSKGKHSDRGFSMVEVVMALGIVSFAFTAILGLLPAGLTTFKAALDNSIKTAIAQRVVNDVQQTDFLTLTQSAPLAFKAPVRYFDGQGNEIIPANPNSLAASEKNRIVYWVGTCITPSTTLPSTASSQRNSNLATVTIQVATNPGNISIPASTTNANLWKTTSYFSIATYSTSVAGQ